MSNDERQREYWESDHGFRPYDHPVVELFAEQRLRMLDEWIDFRSVGRALDVVFRNDRLIPTRTARAAEKKIGEPDAFTLTGKGVEVLAGGFRTDRFRPEAIELAERDPARLLREAGIPGRGEVRVRWIFRGDGQDATIGWEGEKARDATLKVKVR